MGQHPAHGDGGAGGGGNDVVQGGAVLPPPEEVLNPLGGGGGMGGAHQAGYHFEAVVHGFGEGGQAVRGARGVGDNPVLRGEVPVVHADHHGFGFILAGGGDDNFLRSGLDMGAGLFGAQIEAGAVENHIHIVLGPGDVGGVLLGVNGNFVFTDLDYTVSDEFHIRREPSVDGILRQTRGDFLRWNQIVPGDDFNRVVVLRCDNPHHVLADAAHAVEGDSHFSHFQFSLKHC